MDRWREVRKCDTETRLKLCVWGEGKGGEGGIRMLGGSWARETRRGEKGLKGEEAEVEMEKRDGDGEVGMERVFFNPIKRDPRFIKLT